MQNRKMRNYNKSHKKRFSIICAIVVIFTVLLTVSTLFVRSIFCTDDKNYLLAVTESYNISETTVLIDQTNDDNNLCINEDETFKQEIDSDFNYYSSLIIEAALERTPESLDKARLFERKRNIKALLSKDNNLTTKIFTKDKNTWDDVFKEKSYLAFGREKENGKIVYTCAYFHDNKCIVLNNVSFTNNVNYAEKIDECLQSPSDDNYSLAKQYEILRNMKIERERLDYEKTFNFIPYNSWTECFNNGVLDKHFESLDKTYKVVENNVNAYEEPSTASIIAYTTKKYDTVKYMGEINSNDTLWYRTQKDDTIGYIDSNFLSDSLKGKAYTEDDVYWLAVAISYEMGSSWMPEYARNYVGCVVLNRVEDSRFPNTIYSVLHQQGQYSWATKTPYKKPSEYCINTAIDLLEGNRLLPSYVIFQSCSKQGSNVYTSYYDKTLKNTTYFCY